MNHYPDSSADQRATGLRRKVGLLLVGIFAAVLLVSMAVGQRILSDLTTDLSRKLAMAEARLTREKIQALVGRELAMAQRFAGLSALTDWLLDEQKPGVRTRFLAEAAGFRQAFEALVYAQGFRRKSGTDHGFRIKGVTPLQNYLRSRPLAR